MCNNRVIPCHWFALKALENFIQFTNLLSDKFINLIMQTDVLVQFFFGAGPCRHRNLIDSTLSLCISTFFSQNGHDAAL